jgi:hypothetical protein
MSFCIFLVAGPGFAPGSQGYEPCELLLLHPAISSICSCSTNIRAKIKVRNILALSPAKIKRRKKYDGKIK